MNKYKRYTTSFKNYNRFWGKVQMNNDQQKKIEGYLIFFVSLFNDFYVFGFNFQGHTVQRIYSKWIHNYVTKKTISEAIERKILFSVVWHINNF